LQPQALRQIDDTSRRTSELYATRSSDYADALVDYYAQHQIAYERVLLEWHKVRDADEVFKEAADRCL